MKNYLRTTNTFLGALGLLFLLTQCDVEEDVFTEMEQKEIQTATSDSLNFELASPIVNAQISDSSAIAYFVDSTVVDGKALNIQPGDIIGIRAGRNERILFKNIKGTKENPIKIQNFGGVAEIYSTADYGIKFHNSEHFILAGTGSADEFGIRVTTEQGFYVTMEMFTTEFEITRLEIAGKNKKGLGKKSGFAAIGVKTSPYQDCDLFADPTRQAWTMRNVSIHHNYIHDTGGEGLYIGHGMYAGRIEQGCDQVTYSHSIKGLRIHHNLIENVGYDGMQIKNADGDVEVYENTIRNYGTKDHNAHNEGLFIGDGTVGSFYNNLIMNGTGNGCQIQGMGNLNIYNNIFANQKGHGIYAAHGGMVVRDPDGAFNIFNNTVYNSGGYGYVFHHEDGGEKRFINNIVVKADKLYKETDATTVRGSNFFTNDVNEIKFINPELGNFRLRQDSPARKAGTNLQEFGIDEDFEGDKRPEGGPYDAGAFQH